MSGQIKVLVVDDSALMRKLIPQILERDETIQVVGTAMDGEFALKKIEELKPDVVTLDLEMPRMDGMETLKQIVRRHHIPVIVVSAHTSQGASATFKALQLGALDFVSKPVSAASTQLEQIATELIGKIVVASRTPMPRVAALPKREVSRSAKKLVRSRKAPTRVVAIGISTGGPNALQYLLAQLPGDFPGAIVVVQHMPEGFTGLFARRLNECCAIDVKEAQSGDLLIAGRALICPGNRHMKVRRMPVGNIVVLSEEDRVNGHRPSVDVLFHSVADEFGPGAVGVIMTGMGEDGAEGMRRLRDSGAITVAQDEESSVVFGMPKAAIERGYASRVISLEGMAAVLLGQCTGRQHQEAALAGAAEQSL